MIYYRNEQDAYLTWLEHHSSGFVLNVGTGGKTRTMLHTSRCAHIYPPNPTRIHTVGYTKAVSDDREELEIWASEQGLTLVLCPDCDV